MDMKNTIASLAIIGTMGGIGYWNILKSLDNKLINLSSKEENKQTLSDPLKIGPYDLCIISDNSLAFMDNNAVGMKAYIKYKDKELELERTYMGQESAHFKIPESILKSSRGYDVKAVDRHGNITTSRIYTLEGVASTQPFID